MQLPTSGVLAIIPICAMYLAGCNQSNPGEVTEGKAEAEAARAEAQVAKAELARLKVLPKLTAIHLCYNPLITDDGIKELRMSLPNCQVIK